jgi:hypothetical protein
MLPELSAAARLLLTLSGTSDNGQSWSFMQPLEASMELASHGSGFIKGSTAVPPLSTASAGRVWAVYQFNSENTTQTPDGQKLRGRTDMLGKGFFFRWTGCAARGSDQLVRCPRSERPLHRTIAWRTEVRRDGSELRRIAMLTRNFVVRWIRDGGLSWSDRMFREFRSTDIDLRNPWKGIGVKLMHIDAEPEVIGRRVYIPFTSESLTVQSASQAHNCSTQRIISGLA